ncbi:MAG: hypothetical protein JST75_22370 [Bacteroidetes bacterium]|nr:hypothetical protein [Bacteroidota bacterium]
MRRPFILIMGFGCLASCHKNEVSPIKSWSWFGTDNPVVYNYVLINANQVANKLDSNDFHIDVDAAFLDSSNNRIIGVGNLVVNSKPISRNVDSTYSFDYIKQASLNEGLALYGTNVPVSIRGVSELDTVTRSVYLPKKILQNLSDFPDQINVSQNLTLRWVTDQNNPWGKVIIQVYYYDGLSHASDSTLPDHINTLNFTVPDNGLHTIAADDLKIFPAKSYIGISIARGTQSESVLPISKKRIFYFSNSSASTPPVLVTTN